MVTEDYLLSSIPEGGSGSAKTQSTAFTLKTSSV